MHRGVVLRKLSSLVMLNTVCPVVLGPNLVHNRGQQPSAAGLLGHPPKGSLVCGAGLPGWAQREGLPGPPAPAG
eukprot:4192390-Lingulodinium_polyedra.AAC.1